MTEIKRFVQQDRIESVSYTHLNPELYQSNVEALEKVQPEPIKASDISLRLGTTWIPTDVYRQFIFHLLETPSWKQKDIHVIYLAATEEWNVTRKSLDSGVRATKTFGTHRINAYKIIENTLKMCIRDSIYRYMIKTIT